MLREQRKEPKCTHPGRQEQFSGFKSKMMIQKAYRQSLIQTEVAENPQVNRNRAGESYRETELQELELAQLKWLEKRRDKATLTIYMDLGEVRSGWRQAQRRRLSKLNTTEAAVVTSCLIVVL